MRPREDLRAFAGLPVKEKHPARLKSKTRVVHFQLSGRCRAHVQHHVRTRRVVILGRCRESTLARQLGERTGLPVIEPDTLFGGVDWVQGKTVPESIVIDCGWRNTGYGPSASGRRHPCTRRPIIYRTGAPGQLPPAASTWFRGACETTRMEELANGSNTGTTGT
jgi:hypothetical protein